jgi:hypothetical protein
VDPIAIAARTSVATDFVHPRFSDVCLIGEGSMGRVYRAFDRLREDVVAVKTIPMPGPDQVYWLKSEFRSLADVRHRNLAELHELVVEEASCFFTMELVDGVDLVHFVQRAFGGDRSKVAAPTQLAVVRDCIAQLVHGIRAVHRAGKLHRDVKPSNVLVTRDGRVVLLDFGLTMPSRRRGSRTLGGGSISGTPQYMAPEQAEGMPLSAKSDWYSMGVVLYEALTGTTPFAGSFTELLLQKRRRPPDPRERCPALPGPLAALVTSLLEPEPDERPDGESILESLGSDVLRDRPDGDDGWFVGRAEERQQLYRSFERSRTGPVVVHVSGESGIGKTALLQRWCDRIEADERALVLRGRCHPRETLPFKALDGIIDTLSEQLCTLPAAEARGDDGGSLATLFPVLARVPGFAASASPAAPAADPFEARRSAAEALKRLLSALSQRQPIVLWIDDLQWGDVDSAWILRAILHGPDAPHVLLLLSHRSEASEQSSLLAELARAPIESRDVVRADVRLGPLAQAEGETLARLLLDDAAGAETSASVARDAAGSPFFIRELALHQRPGCRSDGPVSLERVLRDRVDQLDDAASRILETTALATTALEVSLVLDAAEVGPAGYGAVARLQSGGFVRLTPLGTLQAIQPYHDRVREAVLSRLSDDAARRRHRRLAEALLALQDTDPEALFHHYRGAGDDASAARYAELAADRAARSLAFDRAASLYAAALELARSAPSRPNLVVRLAEALENNGRTAEAARHYLAAAAVVQRTDGHQALHLALRRRAAVCMMKSGHLGEGRRELWAVLQAIGVRPPRSQRAAIRKTMLLRLPLLVRPIAPPASAACARPEDAVANERLAALWGATTSFVMTEQHTAAYVGAHFVRAAVASGRATEIARALLHEAACEGALRFAYFRRRSYRLLAAMDRMAEILDDPYVSSYVLSVRASNEWEMGRWRNVVELLDRSMRIMKSGCQGISWEIGVALSFSFNATSYLGRMRELAPRLEAELQAAKDRGDVLAMNHFRLGQSSFARLATGEVDYALALADEARASMPPDQFDIPHYHHLMLVAQCHLYRGDAIGAWRCVAEAWPRLRAAQFLQIAFPRVELLHLRARCALALLAARPTGASDCHADDTAPRTLRRLVRQSIRQMRRCDALPAAPMADALEAGLAAVEGDDATARGRLEAAAEGFRASDMALHRDAVLAELGRRLGGDEGRLLASRAGGRVAEQVRDPERIVATLLPGCATAA